MSDILGAAWEMPYVTRFKVSSDSQRLIKYHDLVVISKLIWLNPFANQLRTQRIDFDTSITHANAETLANRTTNGEKFELQIFLEVCVCNLQ